MSLNSGQTPTWFDNRKGKLTYSMNGSRNGSDGTADCSGSVTQAIRDYGGVPYAYLYSTVTLDQYLRANNYTCISRNQEWDAKRGDIVLMSWGADMSTSGGAGGHVGVMKDAWTFISVDYWTGGQLGTAVSEHHIDNYLTIQGPSYFEVWRVLNGNAAPDQPSIPGGNRVGEIVHFGGVFNSSDQASKANPGNGYTPASRLVQSSGKITKHIRTNNVDTYLIDNGFGWINNGDIKTNAATPQPPVHGLISKTGVFYPDRSIPVSSDTDPASPEVARYSAGQAIGYDHYILTNGYAWISYMSSSGVRRYVAVGPDDGQTNTTWGRGFFN